MLPVTRESISEKMPEDLGIVSGSTVQSVHIGKDFMAGFKTLVGGELTSYTEMMLEARKIATGRMITEASALGADAVICMRYAFFIHSCRVRQRLPHRDCCQIQRLIFPERNRLGRNHIHLPNCS